MNREELNPLWNAYKEQINQQHGWSSEDIRELLTTEATSSFPWLLNLCMTLFLIGVTGC